MEKRTLLAIALSFLVLYVYQTFFLPTPPPPVAAESATDENAAQPPAAAGQPVQADVPLDSPDLNAGNEPSASTLEPENEITKLDLESLPVAGAVWRYDAKAGIAGWHLSGFREHADSDILVDFAGLAEESPFLRFWAGKSTAGGSYSGRKRGLLSTIGSVPMRLHSDGEFRFSATVTQPNTTLHLAVTKQYNPLAGISARYMTAGLVFVEKGEVVRKDLEELAETGFRINSDVDWVGIEDKYFIMLFRTRDVKIDIQVRAETFDEGKQHRLTATLHMLPQQQLDLETGSASLGIEGYLGPKEGGKLADLDPELAGLLDFGFFSIVARPMLGLMHLVFDWFGNWGLAIILLTVLIKTLLFPLQIKFTESMYRMQAMKPKIEKLKEKFKDDRARMNQEMAALYKQEGVNPLGGCLPMFLQLPIFIALYNVLYTAIELRHAPFFGWISDLSQAETLFTINVGSFSLPFHLLPIIMAITSFIQTKLTPTSVDNQQQKMMMTWMPVIFTFLFYSLPSGLMLYWLTQNVITIIQNLMIKRRMAQRGLIPG